MTTYISTDKAQVFATAAHAAVGQVRKYDGAPYIVHPIRVANIVRTYGGDTAQISAAYLHDVVEDTHVTIDVIRDTFGDTIADLVDGLTDVSVASDGNRSTRKAMDRQHSANATYEAQFVKCADIIDNASDIAANDPKFWEIYRKEMTSLLEVMDKVKTTPIYAAAVKAVA
tara:strand:- start:12 stop:524 length:513 start_codon:yes stop_codon:yes gene_type:complete